MKKIRRISKKYDRDVLEREVSTNLGKQLQSAFSEAYRKEDQAFINSFEARKEMDEMVDEQVYSVSYGNSNGQPNANGDIIDWSGLTDGKERITWTGDTTYPDGDTGYTSDSIKISTIGTGSGLAAGGLGGLQPPIPQWPPPLGHISVTPYTTSGLGFNGANEKYSVMDLPRKDVPMAVFINGRMLTLGILGTDVECAFTGEQIVFEPGVVKVEGFGGRITASIEYHDEIIHYNIGQSGQITYINERSSTLETTLVSTIKKKVGSSITVAQ